MLFFLFKLIWNFSLKKLISIKVLIRIISGANFHWRTSVKLVILRLTFILNSHWRKINFICRVCARYNASIWRFHCCKLFELAPFWLLTMTIRFARFCRLKLESKFHQMMFQLHGQYNLLRTVNDLRLLSMINCILSSYRHPGSTMMILVSLRWLLVARLNGF